jgi:hypothetical protein
MELVHNSGADPGPVGSEPFWSDPDKDPDPGTFGPRFESKATKVFLFQC